MSELESRGPNDRTSQGADLQCRVRDQNEVIARASVARRDGRRGLRCECGDPCCVALVWLTPAEYEDVRASGSQFLTSVNHEDPLTARVLRETARFAVVDVIAPGPRYAVLARNPRHTWPEAEAASPPLDAGDGRGA